MVLLVNSVFLNCQYSILNNVQKYFFLLMCGEREKDTKYLIYRNCQQFRWLYGDFVSFIIKKTPSILLE